MHYRLITDPTYISPCDINAQFNCSEVYLSRFGSIRGVPVALGGVIFFVTVGLIAALSDARDARGEQPATAYVFAMSTIGLAAILYLGWASFFELKKWCVLCLGTYVAVIGLFIVSGAGSSFPMSRLPGRFIGDLRSLVKRPLHLLATLGAIVMSVSLVGCFPKEGGSGMAATSSPAGSTTPATGGTDQENFEKIWAQQPRVDLGVPPGDAASWSSSSTTGSARASKAAHYVHSRCSTRFEQAMPRRGKVHHQTIR